jgi:hypothetical protein
MSFNSLKLFFVTAAFFIGALSPFDVWGNEGKQTCKKPIGSWEVACYEKSNRKKWCFYGENCTPIKERGMCKLEVWCENEYQALISTHYEWPVADVRPELKNKNGNLQKQESWEAI